MIESVEEKLKSSIFFVEATSFEQYSLQKQHQENYDWEHDTSGAGKIIGYLNEDKYTPVAISFSFAKIDGYRLCFYCPTSNFVDHNMIDSWIFENYPVMWDSGARKAITDANNFHHALHSISELKKQIQ